MDSLLSFSSVARVRYSYAETALSVLVKGLPEMLMRQFEYEDPIVRGGKHLLHSAFFKELVALACDLVSLSKDVKLTLSKANKPVTFKVEEIYV